MFIPDTQRISRSHGRDDRENAGKPENREPVLVGPDKTRFVLPPADTKRWSSRRKAAVIVATRAAVITREEACRRYMLSDEELAGWEIAFDRSGIRGLRITSHSSDRGARRIKQR